MQPSAFMGAIASKTDLIRKGVYVTIAATGYILSAKLLTRNADLITERNEYARRMWTMENEMQDPKNDTENPQYSPTGVST